MLDVFPHRRPASHPSWSVTRAALLWPEAPQSPPLPQPMGLAPLPTPA